MEQRKNLCAQIPVSLHQKVREEQEKAGKPLSEYIAAVLTEYFEYKENEKGGGINMAGKTRTLAFQVSEDLFQRVKVYLAGHPRLSQKDFVVNLIEQAVSDWEAEQKNQSEDTLEETEPLDGALADAIAEELDSTVGDGQMPELEMEIPHEREVEPEQAWDN